MALRRRESPLGLSIERSTGRREEHLPGSRRAASFVELERADDVGSGVGNRVRNAVSQIDVRGVVGDELDLFLGQQWREVRLGNVGVDEAGGLRKALAAAGGQVIHDDDPVPIGKVAFGHVGADEARAAGDEDVHRILSRCRAAA